MHTHLSHPCQLCGASTKGAQLCPGCQADLPLLPEARCPQCALPSPGGSICGQCLRHPRAFDRTEAVYSYAFPLDALIRQCKYHGAVELTELFARAMATQVGAHPEVDLMVPMPLHTNRIAERGFNQAAEIARRLSRILDIPWNPHLCKRVRDTQSQAGLDLRQRKRNLKNAFQCDGNLAGRRVALVDDVMTSGTSLDTLAKAARQAGARHVSAWVVARTL